MRKTIGGVIHGTPVRNRDIQFTKYPADGKIINGVFCIDATRYSIGRFGIIAVLIADILAYYFMLQRNEVAGVIYGSPANIEGACPERAL